MNNKYSKQLNAVIAFALVLGVVTLFAPTAKADPVIMSPGLYADQVYPGYVGPVIMGAGTYSGPSTTPVIPDAILYSNSAPMYPTYQAPAYQQAPQVIYTQPTYTQPTVVYTQAPTQVQSQVVYTQPTQTQTPVATSHVLGTTVHAPKVNAIKTTANPTAVTANSTVPGICASDTVNYTLNYANTTGTTITNAMLVISMPAEIDYKSSTAQASYNDRNRTVTVFVGTLTKGQSGIVYLQGTANRMVNGTATISTRVDFTFIRTNGATETTTSYVIHSGTNCANALGANVLGSGFLPTSFGGWVLLAVILCAIIFIVRKFFGQEATHAHGGQMGHQVH